MLGYRTWTNLGSKIIAASKFSQRFIPQSITRANFSISCNNFERVSRHFHSLEPDREYEVLEESDEIKCVREDTINLIKNLVTKDQEGRLFAIVHLCGKQFKITSEDIIILEGYWPPQPGDRIRLEKVLLLGGADFTLIGRPVLPQSLVTVTATVIEKDLSHTRPVFYKKPRKQYMRLNFHRAQQTMLRINDIILSPEVGEIPGDTEYNRV